MNDMMPITHAEAEHAEQMAIAAVSDDSATRTAADIILGELSRDLLPRAIADIRRLRSMLAWAIEARGHCSRSDHPECVRAHAARLAIEEWDGST